MSKYDNRSNRLPEYDYSQPGAYFITLCAYKRAHLFGKIVDEDLKQAKMVYNTNGEIVRSTWHDLIHHIDGIELDDFVIMPNHFHGILFILDSKFVATDFKPACMELDLTSSSTSTCTQYALPEIVRQLKTFSARRINAMHNTGHRRC